eukprot:312423-Alexandrium_andersonii.AAC.1
MLASDRLGLLQVPAGHRCEAARRFAYQAGRNYNELISILRGLCAGVVETEDPYRDQDCPGNIKYSLQAQ